MWNVHILKNWAYKSVHENLKSCFRRSGRPPLIWRKYVGIVKDRKFSFQCHCLLVWFTGTGERKTKGTFHSELIWRQNLRGNKNPLTPHFSIPMHKEWWWECTCHPLGSFIFAIPLISHSYKSKRAWECPVFHRLFSLSSRAALPTDGSGGGEVGSVL